MIKKITTIWKLLDNIKKINKLEKELFYKSQILDSDFFWSFEKNLHLIFECIEISHNIKSRIVSESNNNLSIEIYKIKSHRTGCMGRINNEDDEGFTGERSKNESIFIDLFEVCDLLKTFPDCIKEIFEQQDKSLIIKILEVPIAIIKIIGFTLCFFLAVIYYWVVAKNIKRSIKIYNSLKLFRNIEKSYHDTITFVSHLNLLLETAHLLRWFKYGGKTDPIILKSLNKINNNFPANDIFSFIWQIFKKFDFYNEKNTILLATWRNYFSTDFLLVTEALLQQKKLRHDASYIPENMKNFLNGIEKIKLHHELQNKLCIEDKKIKKSSKI